MIYASVLVVIIAVALVLLYGLLKDYEAGRPANTMDKLVSHIEAGNVANGLRMQVSLESSRQKILYQIILRIHLLIRK